MPLSYSFFFPCVADRRLPILSWRERGAGFRSNKNDPLSWFSFLGQITSIKGGKVFTSFFHVKENMEVYVFSVPSFVIATVADRSFCPLCSFLSGFKPRERLQNISMEPTRPPISLTCQLRIIFIFSIPNTFLQMKTCYCKSPRYFQRGEEIIHSSPAGSRPHRLINIDTKAKCRNLKKLTCKGTLRKVYRSL